MRAVILQPMYIPWVGYFGMMQQADVFVFHDDIEFVRQSWQRRNRIKVPEDQGAEKWLSVPVIKDQGQKINEVEINNNIDWRDEHWQNIIQAYSEEPIPYGGECAPYFKKYEDVVQEFYEREWESLSDLTKYTVKQLAESIGIGETEIMSTSEMDIEGTKTERVINILKSVGADSYISGPGAKDYLDEDQFDSEKITLYWHMFDHPEYQQPYGQFRSHMSALDFLFNVGPETEPVLRGVEEDSLVKE